MNSKRRKALQELNENLAEIKEQVETLCEEETVYMDNIPENLQSSVRYEQAENAVEALESAISALEEASEYLTEAVTTDK